jgi:hypothetical protein
MHATAVGDSSIRVRKRIRWGKYALEEESPLPYEPELVDTSKVELGAEILELTELLARHGHGVWARQRLAEGWSHGPCRDDSRKEHPCLVPYEQLPESEKQYDRNTALEALKMILALGYRITKD